MKMIDINVGSVFKFDNALFVALDWNSWGEYTHLCLATRNSKYEVGKEYFFENEDNLEVEEIITDQRLKCDYLSL